MSQSKVPGLDALGDQVIILPTKEETSAGGIALPHGQGDTNCAYGEVVAMGDGKLLDNGMRAHYSKVTLQPGAKVAYPRFGVMKLKHAGIEYDVCREEGLLAHLS
jgi:chaperonin GroES